MTSRDNTKKVTARHIEKQAQSPFRCANCGATFISESEKKTHEEADHKQSKKPGSASGVQ